MKKFFLVSTFLPFRSSLLTDVLFEYTTDYNAMLEIYRRIFLLRKQNIRALGIQNISNFTFLLFCSSIFNDGPFFTNSTSFEINGITNKL